jgi:phage gp16-like protein
MAAKKDSRLTRAGVSGYNKPKKTPNHPTKSHVVVAKVGDKVKTIRFGQQGVKGSPKKKGESAAARKRRASFKARHKKNISKGKMSAAYWADRVKW